MIKQYFYIQDYRMFCLFIKHIFSYLEGRLLNLPGWTAIEQTSEIRPLLGISDLNEHLFSTK